MPNSSRLQWELSTKQMEVIVGLLERQDRKNPVFRALYDSADTCLLEHLIIHAPRRHHSNAAKEKPITGLLTPRDTPAPHSSRSFGSVGSALTLNLDASRTTSPPTKSRNSLPSDGRDGSVDSLDGLGNATGRGLHRYDSDDLDSQGDEDWPNDGEGGGGNQDDAEGGNDEDGNSEDDNDGGNGGADQGSDNHEDKDDDEDEDEDEVEDEESASERPRKRRRVTQAPDDDEGHPNGGVRLPGGIEPIPPKAGGKCPRGSGAPWRRAEAALTTPYSEATRTVIGRLIVAAEQLQPQDATSWSFSIASYLHLPHSEYLKLPLSRGNSMASVVKDINKFSSVQAGEEFCGVVNLMRLACQVDCYVTTLLLYIFPNHSYFIPTFYYHFLSLFDLLCATLRPLCPLEHLLQPAKPFPWSTGPFRRSFWLVSVHQQS
ncbi:hypothetical protein ONZ45_g14356 [Pleurotus djamor]|nr:hypothetical protein ONZ45_g14356 [Pleurotus djamor]